MHVLSSLQTDLLPPGMPAARKAIEALEAAETLGLCETPLLKEDLTVLHACYNKAAIPNMFLNFLRNYRENPAYFPSLYTGHTVRPFPVFDFHFFSSICESDFISIRPTFVIFSPLFHLLRLPLRALSAFASA